MGLTFSNATKSVVEDPNKGKAGFAINPSTGTWTRIPSNPQGMDWTFDEQMWAWKPPGDTGTRFKTVPVGTDSNGGTGGTGGTGGVNGTEGPKEPEAVTNWKRNNPQKLGESDQAYLNRQTLAMLDIAAGTNGANGTGGPIFTTDSPPEIFEAPPAAPAVDPGSELPSAPVETHQDLANKYIRAIKADPLARTIVVDGVSSNSASLPLEVRKIINTYLGSREYDSLATSTKAALSTRTTGNEGQPDAGQPAATGDPNEGRSGFFKNPFSGLWETPPQNPFGTWGEFNQSSWSWKNMQPAPAEPVPAPAAPTAPTAPTVNIEDMIANLKYTTSDGSVASVSLSEKQKGDLRSAYSTGGQEAFDALVDSILGHWGEPSVEDPPVVSTYNPQVATLYRGRIAKLTQDALDQDQGGFTLVERLVDEIQADQTINDQERGDLLALLSSKRSSLKPDPVPVPEANQLEIIKGYTAQAEAGTLDPEGIAALGLSDAANSTVLAAYHAGVARRKQEAADANKAAQAEAEATELAGIKARLLENPDLSINFNSLLTQSPNVARDLQAWMEDPNSEYTAAARAAGMIGGGEVPTFESLLTGAGDVALDIGDLAALRTAYNSSTNKEYAFNTELAKIINAKAAAGEDDTEAFLGSPVEDLIANAGYNLPDGTRVPISLSETQKTELRAIYTARGQEGFDEYISEISDYWANRDQPDRDEVSPVDALINATPFDFTEEQKNQLRGVYEVQGEEAFNTLRDEIAGVGDDPAPPAAPDDDFYSGEMDWLSALPTVPSGIGNTEGFMWLMEQGVLQSDAQKWFDWAESTGRKATVVEDPAAPTTGTEIGTEFDVTRDMDITSVLSRLPAIPAEMSNVDALNWLADSEINPDVDPKDAAAWANWAKENRVTKVPEAPEVPLDQYAAITPDLEPSAIKGLREEVGMADAQIVRAGEVFKGPGGIDAFNGYVEAFQAGTLDAWETNYAALMSARDEAGVVDEDEEVESLYEEDPQFEANVTAINVDDLILRLPTPPVGLDAMEQFFWMADQKDETGESILTPEEATAYYRWSLGQQNEVDRNTGVDGDGGVGDASDPSNLEKIQGTIADEIEDVVQEIGFNSEEYKTSQTAALESYYGDARIRLGRQFAIDPGGPKTGRAQRNFEILEGERIQDLSSLASEVQDRLQAARDSTITNLTNAFSAITTGKIAEAQLDEQQRQFNTEIRETVRQFNNDLAIRLKEFGLNEDEVEAAIRKVNSDIVNNTRSISASISQAWADVTGELSVPGGVISLADLGIAEEDWAQFPFLPPSEDMVNSIRLSFEAMLGREITGAEMNNLLANGKITVADKMPTQKAKEFAATIMQQNMERVSKWDAIARENQLDADKFADAKDRADKEWNRLNLEVAEQYGLDSNIFRNSMWDLDQRLSKIFFNEEYTEVERDRARRGAINDVSGAYFPDQQGAFLQAKDQYDLLYGDRESAVARAFGMDAETFSRANRQADEQEQRMLTVWSSLQESASTKRERIDDIYLGEPSMRNLSRDLISLTQPYLASLGELYMEDVDDIGDGTSSTVTEAIDWLFLPDQEDSINAIRSDFESLFPNYVFTDDQLKFNMSDLLNSYQLEKAKNPDVAMADVSFHWEGTKSDWFSSLDPTVQTAMMSLISGSNFSPEREAGGASALQSIGVLLGTGLGAYAGFKTAGPAGIIPGADAGANVAATVTS